MSSVPTDRVAAAPPVRAARSRGAIKRLLPRTLFGRAILILVTPLILVLAVATLVFYDRLWETVQKRLASGVAGDIALVIDSINLVGTPEQRENLLELASRTTDLELRFEPGATLKERPDEGPHGQTATVLRATLTQRLQLPYLMTERRRPHTIYVWVQLPDGLLDVSIPFSRLYSSDNWIFMTWMISTALITCAVATLFLKNQIRSLHRLAVAAEAFGKGRDIPEFRPEGAAEVRQAAMAFLLMRDRIRRQISQRTEMLAGVSHDLRSPLTRMKLELALLGDGEEIQGLRSDVAEMEQMVEGYLAFVRGEGDEPPQVTDLVELIGDAAAAARRGGGAIELILPAELHVPIRRDAFRRCLMNLISNAVRHARNVWVAVVADRRAVDITVDDDGPGIPEAQREAVFRPFFRLEVSRNRATGGVGLGLTIARDIMRSHGGDLTLETSPRGGLRARLHLPR
ncbi:MAG TPA: ATP-binding protein [Stellaceae bacterium]|nr:ATP-binding protein [Stellaceae bacterium]